MVCLPRSRRTGLLVRRRRPDEHSHILGQAVVRPAEGEPDVLVELLPARRGPILPVHLRFMGISPAALPDRGAGIAFGGLRAAGRSGVAAYGVALGRDRCLIAGWHQPLIFGSVLRYRNRLRRSSLCVLLGRVRTVRALSPSSAPTWLGPSGARVLPVRGSVGCQGDRCVATRGRGVVRVGMASARELEARGIVALDTAGGGGVGPRGGC